MIRTTMASAAVLALLLGAGPGLAQRTDDNAVTDAEDAFGKSVGDNSIGIYNQNDVRGFSPADAGNLRIEGLYYDQQAGITGRVQQGTTIRVGISAQSYPFPAPTGVADFSLRKPGDKAVASVGLRYGDYGSKVGEVDIQVPIDGARLGVIAGAGLYREQEPWGGTPNFFSTGALLRYAPRPGIEIMPFVSRIRGTDEEAQPLIFSAGSYLPKRIARSQFRGQPWHDNRFVALNYGLLARADPLGFDVRFGIFRSVFDSAVSTADLLFDTDLSGQVGRRVLVRERGFEAASTSGELRVSREFKDGPRRHAIVAALRGRQQDRRYGGAAIAEITGSRSDVADFRDPASVTFSADGPQTLSKVTQGTLGVAYQGKWAGIGEFSLGIQKTRYVKSVTDPDPLVTLPETRDSPWLPNATVAITVTPALAIYGGYTRGLEESPAAPDNAVNRNEAPPAIRTTQKDAGVRWSISPGVTAVVGVFEVAKPYFNVDPVGQFRQLGTVTNRGLEISIAGPIAPGLNLVAGNVLIDSALSGEEVDRGVIGKKPVGTFVRHTIVSLDYRLPWHDPLSLDATFEGTSDRTANAANDLVIPTRAVMNLGARYRLKMARTPVLLRAQVGNVTNTFGWNVGGSGFFIPNGARRFSFSVAADI